jgi:hypothetical protein
VSGLAIPENVVEAAARAMYEVDRQHAQRFDRGEDVVPWEAIQDHPVIGKAWRLKARKVVQAALAEWGATVDDDDGHNSHYRVITGWTPKPERQARA